MSETKAENSEPVAGPVEPTVKPLCAHCGFALPASGAGVRHYGTHTAHQENECLRLMHAEIARLRAAASQASFCLRTLLPADADAQMTVRMLEDALKPNVEVRR